MAIPTTMNDRCLLRILQRRDELGGINTVCNGPVEYDNTRPDFSTPGAASGVGAGTVLYVVNGRCPRIVVAILFSIFDFVLQ
jgi:hypothetical protein